MNRIKSLGALIMIACLQVSCNEEKSYEFDEPYANHLSFLGLSEGVKSVSYEKQIYEISDGGYFPMTTNTNDIMATFEYPYSINGLKYMGNFTSAMVFNYPFTANQYLINELILGEISSQNVKIEFEGNKVKRYTAIRDDKSYVLDCEYGARGNLVSIDIQDNGSRKVIFKNKGNFLSQIIHQRKDESDTLNLSLEKINENQFKIKSKDNDIAVYLENHSTSKGLERIEYPGDQATIKFMNNQITEKYKIQPDGKYSDYQKISYENGRVSMIMSSDSYKRTTVRYNLNRNLNISSIHVETDKEQMRDLGFNFTYENNNRNDWVEMNFVRDRQLYDDAVKNVEYVSQRLQRYGYSGMDLLFHSDYKRAIQEQFFAKSYCSKTQFKRNIKYVN